MIYRQGDVILVPRDGMPSVVQARHDGVLAFGEVTGHKHQVAVEDRAGAKLYNVGGGGKFLQVTAEGGISIVHEEHDTLTIPAGNYDVRVQREYHPSEIRNVSD